MRGVVAFCLIHWCLDMELDLRPAVILMFYFFCLGILGFLSLFGNTIPTDHDGVFDTLAWKETWDIQLIVATL